jgi:K+-sensing histidine kinase KdpD
MKKAPFQADRYYRILIALGGLVFLLFGILRGNWSNVDWEIFLLLSLVIGFLTQFSTHLLQGEINLIQVVALGGLFIVGPIPMAWATALGILGGSVFRWFGREKRTWRRFLKVNAWVKIGYKNGLVSIPLVLLLSGSIFSSGLTSDLISDGWKVDLTSAILYVSFHGILFIVNFFLKQKPSSFPKFRKDLLTLVAIELLTVPFVLLVISNYSKVGGQALWFLGGVPAISGYLLSRMNSTQIEFDRRTRELSTLEHISHTLRTNLDLDELLPVIQQQVMKLLEVNNFYIALYEPEPEELWYPFAVKFGKQQNWQRRRVSNRLTERVIQEEKPILLNPETRPILAPVGLPPSEESPTSWLGVPLISSERTIGCLAVFTLDPDTYFTAADVEVLTILSGQVSVAIENALLYQQVQQRAQQLETLNQLTTAITASLDLQEVLKQVCNAVALVIGGQRSAVFLLDPSKDNVFLAHTHGLDEAFAERNAAFSIANSRRARCLRTGKPMAIPDLQNSSLSIGLIQHFRADKIQAFADFPMITPDGAIGFLSVYFNQKHVFSPEEVGVLQTFASQAALAVANARLHARTDATLARRVNQLTTLEAVGRELSAATHSDRLYNLILEYALEVTNSYCGSVAIYDPDTKKIVVKASYGYDLGEDDFPVGKGITGRVVQTHRLANIGNVTEDPDFIDLRDGNTRSQLSVPVIHENRLLGVISLESPESEAYSEGEEAFVTQLANQAAVDIINSELYHETQRRLREQSTLYQVSTRLVSAVAPDLVAQTITQAIEAVLQPHAVGIYIWRKADQKYILLGEANYHLPIEIYHSLDTGEFLSQTGLSTIKKQHNLNRQLSQDCFDCNIFTLPLEMSHQHPGLVVLHLHTDQQIDEEEIKLLKAILAQGSIALQNAHYFQEATNGRDRLTAILNSIEEGILMVDIDGSVLLANEPVRTLLGLPLDKFFAIRLHDLPDEALRTLGYNQAEIRTLLEALRKKQVPASPKVVVEVHHSQRTSLIERITTPVWGGDGAVIGWMLLLRDVTEEHELEQTREAITETIVHDLRSPMSAIVGALDLLSDCLYDPTVREQDEIVIEQALLVAQRSANRVLSLTEAFLDIARLQSGRMVLDYENIDLANLISELLVEFKAMANDDSVILRSQIPADLPAVLADREKLIRILTNLVDNAIKFTPEGEYITVSVKPVTDNGVITITVEDSGPGIPAEYREKIFERFVQVPGQRPRRRGTGLGLAFCRLAVEAHGGRIWVDDSPEGGSNFSFTLPVAPPVDAVK